MGKKKKPIPAAVAERVAECRGGCGAQTSVLRAICDTCRGRLPDELRADLEHAHARHDVVARFRTQDAARVWLQAAALPA